MNNNNNTCIYLHLFTCPYIIPGFTCFWFPQKNAADFLLRNSFCWVLGASTTNQLWRCSFFKAHFLRNRSQSKLLEMSLWRFCSPQTAQGHHSERQLRDRWTQHSAILCQSFIYFFDILQLLQSRKAPPQGDSLGSIPRGKWVASRMFGLDNVGP